MKLKALIQRIPVDQEVQSLTKYHRTEVSIPQSGFDDFKDWEDWSRSHDSELVSENFRCYFKKVEKIIPYKGLISKIALKGIILDFFYFKDFNIDLQFKRHRFDLFSVGFVQNKEVGFLNLSQGKGIEDGVYVRIPSNIDPSEIKDYVSQNKEVITSVQSLFNERKGYVSTTLRYLDSLERDEIISALFEYSLSDLEEISKMPRNKGVLRQDYVAMILKEYLGFKSVSGEAVLKAKKRWSKKKKHLWGTTNI